MKQLKLLYTLQLTIILLCANLISSAPANAMGSSPPKPKPTPTPSPITGGPTTQIPQPARRVVLRSVATQLFHLPDGSLIDLTADLNSIFRTAVTAQSAFSPMDSSTTDPAGLPADLNDACGRHIEVRGSLSTLELNNAEFGISFGYNPGGAIQTGTQVSGTLDVKVGTMTMDFSVWQCEDTRCWAVAASQTNQNTSNIDLKISLDLSAIHAAPSFVSNTSLGKSIRTMMNDGMKKIVDSSRVSELNWSALVRDANPTTGSVIFDAGFESRLAPAQMFTVFAADPASGNCAVFKSIAYIGSERVDAVSTVAKSEQLFGTRPVQAGDVVMIRRTPVINGKTN